MTLEPNQLVGFLAAWTPEPENPDSRTHFAAPDAWLPALEAQPHPGSIDLPHMLP